MRIATTAVLAGALTLAACSRAPTPLENRLDRLDNQIVQIEQEGQDADMTCPALEGSDSLRFVVAQCISDRVRENRPAGADEEMVIHTAAEDCLLDITRTVQRALP